MHTPFTTQQSSASTAIIRSLVKGAIAFACLQATVIYLQMIGLAPSNHDTFVVTGTFGNPAPVGGFLAICASLALHQSLYAAKRWPWIVITSSLLIACVLTDSRAALLGFIVGATMLLLIRYPISNKWLRHAVYIGLPILGLLLVVGMYMYRPLSANGRFLIWKVCIKHIIAAKPLFGHGVGGFHREYMPAQAEYFASGCATETETLLAADNTFPFNEFIRIACEFGIIGVLLVIIILSAIIYSGIEVFPSLRGAAITALVCGIVFACFSYPLDVPVLRFLYAILILCALPPLKLNECRRRMLYFCIGIAAAVLIGGRTSSYIHFHRMDRALTKLLVSDDRANKAYIKESIANFADNERILSKYAYILYEKGQYKEAIPILEQSISLFPTAEKILDLGDAYKEVKIYGKAIECYRTASYMLPAYVTPPYKLFCLYNQLGINDKAVEYARQIDSMKAKVENRRVMNIKKEAKGFLQLQQ